MDQAKKQKLSVIVLKTLLYEILKNGTVNSEEKRIFQKLLKTVKLSKQDLADIQKEAKLSAKQYPENNPYNPKVYLKKLKDQLTEELNPKLNRNFLIKIAGVISSDKDIIENFIPSLFKDVETANIPDNKVNPIKSFPSNADTESKDSIMETSAEDLASDSEILDSIDILKTQLPDQSLKYFNIVINHRSHGRHEQAIEQLLDYSVPLNFDVRYYLLSRMYFEIHLLDESKQYLIKAKKSGLDERIFTIENYFCAYETLDSVSRLEQWKKIVCKSSPDQVVDSLVNNLRNRNRNILALELLESLHDDHLNGEPALGFKYLDLLNAILSKTFVDIYFRYYGMAIIVLQLSASILVLSICLYNIGYIGPAFTEILHQMVAGIPDNQLFYESLKKILPFTFLIIALVPVCYINSIMIWAGLQKKTKSYAEIHESFIKICDFGKIYHLSFTDKDKPIFLYQDDNDYTYVSMVRHLPFVPNFTYIYAYDHIRGIYCLLPLYGVADGYLFSKTSLSSAKSKIYSMNMLGVRLAQASTVVAKLSRTYLVVLPLIILMGIFFYANINFAEEASFESYLTTFMIFLIAVIAIICLPFITLKWLQTNYINKILMINIIKPGLILLVGLYLIQHYKHFGYSGIIPMAACLYSFFLLFIRTKYPPEKKQIVAQISASSSTVNEQQGLISLTHGLKAVYLGTEPNSKRNSVYLFFNNNHIAISRKIYGMTLYYDVIQLTSKFKILVMETEFGSKLRISTYNFDIDRNPEDVIEALTNANLQCELCNFTEKSRSKIAVNQLLACLTLWIGWQFTAGFVPTEYKLRKFEPEITQINYVVDYLTKNPKSDGSESVNLVHIFDGLEYEREIDYNKEYFSFYQNREITWGEYETSFQKAINYRSNLTTKDKMDQNEIDIAISKLPPFVKSDGFRDDVINFFDWHLFTRWRTIDSSTQGNHIINYCPLVHSQVTQREGSLRCAYRFSYEQAIEWINFQKKIPFQFDIEILKELASLEGGIIQYASNPLNKDYSLVLAAVSQNGLNLEHAHFSLKNDPRIVLAALRQNYLSYKYMSDQMWSNVRVMRFLVNKRGSLLSDPRVGLNVKKNVEAVLSALKQDPAIIKEIYESKNFELFMDKQLLDNRNIALKLLENQGMFLEELNDNFKQDRLVVLKAIANNGLALKYATNKLKSDPSVVAKAIEQNVKSVEYMDRDLWKDRSIVSLILIKNGMYLEYVDQSLKNDEDAVFKAVSQNSRASEYMDTQLWSDEKIVKKILQGNGLSLENAADSLKNNYDIALTAVKQNGMALQFVSEKLRANKDIIVAALKSDGRALRYGSLFQRKDQQLIELAVNKNIESLRYAEIPEDWFKMKVKAIYVAYIYEFGIGRAQNLGKAKDLYSQAVQIGDTRAMIRLAYIYLEGRGTNRDYDNAYRLFNLAAESGNIEGLVMLGYMKENALSVNKDQDGAEQLYLRALARSLDIEFKGNDPLRYKGGYAKAAYYLGKLYESLDSDSSAYTSISRGFLLLAAEQGYLEAQKALAKLSFEGKTGARSFKDSLRWSVQSGRQGDLNSLFLAALHYDLGLGINSDHKRATTLYKEASINGYPGINCLIYGTQQNDKTPPLKMGIDDYIKYSAERGSDRFQCLMASYYDIGTQGIRQNKQEAFELMKKSAKQGHPEAQVYLSQALMSRAENPSERKEANEWLEKALLQKYPKAYTLKADTYLSKDGYSQDYDSAIKWLLKAANLNERTAQRKLGILYNRGDGVTKDQEIAFQWLNKASLNGDAKAMLNMATMYEFGNGVSKNEQKAVLWYKNSALLGNKQAAENLQILEDQGINIHRIQLNKR